MVTIEQYNRAVQTINEFHEQIDKSIKTTLTEFLVANKDLNTRTHNGLSNLNYYSKKNNHTMYVEDLDKTRFLKATNLGKKSWENFVKARGY